MPTPSRSPQVVLVTGASSGIGRATALRAAARGDHVLLLARDEAALLETADACVAARAASTTVLTADVGDDAQVAVRIEEAFDRHGRIDAVVDSAGVVAYGRTEDVPSEVFERVVRTNLLGSLHVARYVVPRFRRQGYGTLVVVGSVIGHIAVPTMSAYAVSKWALRALARHLRVENRDVPDLHVVYVAPGGVDTPIYQQAANYLGHQGRPPPPVATPEHAAAQILRRIDLPWLPEQLTVANHVLRFGFTALPRVYDALVGPLFTFAGTDLTRRTTGTPGNVADPQPDGHALRGDQVPVLAGLLRNARALLDRARTRPDPHPDPRRTP